MTTAENTWISLQRRTVLAAMVAAIGLGVAARAEAAPGILYLQVVDRETGETAKVWRSAGRLFVAGRPGARYSLRVTNTTGGRVLAVMSVDGVNIITGQTASYGQDGYVFEPYQSYDVNGWRKSDSEIAAFTFAPLPKSYAARTGRPHDVGVIGLAAFAEKAEITPEPSSRIAPSGGDDVVTTSSRMGTPPPLLAPVPAAKAAPSPAQMARPPEKLGTAHGALEWSEVTSVPFERATSYPQLVLKIEYDSYANLVANGVIPPGRQPPLRPRPFPSAGDRHGYVPDPPGN